jgi:hypothetical protein
MTDDEIDKLCREATPGPWRVGANGSAIRADREHDDRIIAQAHPRVFAKLDPGVMAEWVDNAEFIAAARTLVPELHAEVRRLREQHLANVRRDGELRERIALLEQERTALVEGARRLAEERDRLRVALADLGPKSHSAGCLGVRGWGGGCVCGADDNNARVAAALEVKP